MNALGIALVWCVLQVTLIGLLTVGLYLVARWLRPAVATPIVSSGLAAVVLLSLLALSPWPRWSLVDAPPDESAVADGAAEAPAESAPRVSSAGLLRQALVEELLYPPAEEAADGWRWPALAAIVLLVAMAGGLAWLVVGLLAVRWQRRSGRPVHDRELAELLDVLCAELRCLRPIEVRQCDDLVTAATVGWRRPTLLLPQDWRSWTPDERQAILAHEIAHARRHDFVALLCGQAALALHFYHPLLHWLAHRLRLEQELAADAAAARISGGQRQYLTTIAELALRQQDRPLLWPARTFLPTRTTFLRRIAMLRDGKPRNDRLSPLSRFTAAGVVLLCGLAVAGLRGPAPSSEALAAGPTKPVAAKGPVRLGYTGESSTDKRSLGGSGHAIAFERPAAAKYLTMVQIYASRYGLPQPPNEDFHVYVLDNDQKVLQDVLFPYSCIQYGASGSWHRLYVPANETPERFYLAFAFNPQRTKGIYLGLDKNVEQSHSYIGLPDQGFQPVPEKYDWMVQAWLVSDAKKAKPPRGAIVGRRGAVVAEKAAESSAAPRDPDSAAEQAVKAISTMAETDPQVAKTLQSLKGLNQARVVARTAKFLDAEEDTMRRSAVYILWRGQFASIEPAVAQLLRLCEHKEDLTRGMAAIALGANRAAKSQALLTKMTTDDPSGYARRCAAYALGLLGDKSAIPTLKKALQDPESMVRANAQAALRMLDKGPQHTQAMSNDIQPDGAIRFAGGITVTNSTASDMTTYGFINSDFVKLEKITDAAGKAVEFTANHKGNIFQYRATLNRPLPAGESVELKTEGTITTLIKPGPEPGEFTYRMKHWPATGADTRRVETHLLPRGAELLSKSPAEMSETRKDGRIELKIDRVIPAGGSLEVTYRYRLKPGK